MFAFLHTLIYIIMGLFLLVTNVLSFIENHVSFVENYVRSIEDVNPVHTDIPIRAEISLKNPNTMNIQI